VPIDDATPDALGCRRPRIGWIACLPISVLLWGAATSKHVVDPTQIGFLLAKTTVLGNMTTGLVIEFARS
jgi:hypothetical protein